MKKELSRNWEYITIRRDPARAEFICKNLQRWGFETFILKHKTVNSNLAVKYLNTILHVKYRPQNW